MCSRHHANCSCLRDGSSRSAVLAGFTIHHIDTQTLQHWLIPVARLALVAVGSAGLSFWKAGSVAYMACNAACCTAAARNLSRTASTVRQCDRRRESVLRSVSVYFGSVLWCAPFSTRSLSPQKKSLEASFSDLITRESAGELEHMASGRHPRKVGWFFPSRRIYPLVRRLPIPILPTASGRMGMCRDLAFARLLAR
jgi:hypothetical protein